LTAFVSTLDSWAPIPAHDATIHDFGLLDHPPTFDPLSLGQSPVSSTKLFGGHDQYYTQTQPNDLSIMGTPYDTRSLDSSLKDCTPPGQSSSSPTDSSLAAPCIPKAPYSVSPKTTDPDSARIVKRTRNTLAARRYRQRRVDQMSDLEAALKETQAERDALKVRVARLEGELDALRGPAR
jgi:hypothetical protein